MILSVYIRYAIALCGLIIFAIFIFSAKIHIFNIKKLKGKQLEFAKKHSKTVTKIARVICAVSLGIVLPLRIIPLTIDIPSAITSNYREVTVEVVKNDISNPEKPKQRDIVVRDVTNWEEYTVHIFAKQIQRGEILKIRILPFSKFGELSERIGDVAASCG